MKLLGIVLLMIAVVTIACIAGAFLTMWVWNSLAHYFGFRTISWFIALVINFALSLVGGAFKASRK